MPISRPSKVRLPPCWPFGLGTLPTEAYRRGVAAENGRAPRTLLAEAGAEARSALGRIDAIVVFWFSGGLLVCRCSVILSL